MNRSVKMSIRGITTAGLVNPVVTMQDKEGVEVVNAGLINGNSSPSSGAFYHSAALLQTPEAQAVTMLHHVLL